MNNNTFKVCNIEYDNTLNKRIVDRYFPNQSLQPNLDPRPSSTKYQKYPFIKIEKNSVNLNKYPYFNPEKTFYTGNAKAPIHFVMDSVDTESRLRNQFFALQKNDQAQYIPSLNSSLYNMNSPLQQRPNNSENYNKIENIAFNPDKCNLAPETFNNNTRLNLKNLK